MSINNQFRTVSRSRVISGRAPDHLLSDMYACAADRGACMRVVLHRDARGMTPFMLAVSGRAYPAAITVLEAAQKIAKGEFA